MGKRQEIEVPSKSIIDEMRPDVPPEVTDEGRKEVTEAAGGNARQDDSERSPRDSPKTRSKSGRGPGKVKRQENTPEEEEFLASFIETPTLATIARQGKLAYLTPRNHNRILKVINVIGHNQLNIATYLNRIVDDHFDRNDAVIKSLLEKNFFEEF